MKTAAALTTPALGNARKARAPDALTLAAPEETHRVPTPGSQGTSSPLPAPPLPNFRAPPRPAPDPLPAAPRAGHTNLRGRRLSPGRKREPAGGGWS